MIGTEKSLDDALECLMGNGLHCDKCVYNIEGMGVAHCVTLVASDAQELLNRKKKRICGLKRKIEKMKQAQG